MQETFNSIAPTALIIAIILVLVLLIGIPLLLRRRKAAEDDGPDIGTAIDYTSLPVEEPSGWRERFANLSLPGKILLVVIPLLLIISAAVLVLMLSPNDGERSVVITPTPLPPSITITQADLVNATTIEVVADTTLADGTPVEVQLLAADGQPFPWFNPDAAQGTVTENSIDLRLPRAQDSPQATRGVTYTVVLATADKAVSDQATLVVPSLYANDFYAPEVAAQPTRTPTLTPTAGPTQVLPTPTPTVVVLAGTPATVSGNGGNVRRHPLIRDDNRVALVSGGEAIQVLGRTPNGEWYRIRTPRNEIGWISASLVALDAGQAANVSVESVVTVFVAGPVRDQSTTSSRELDRVAVNEIVELLQKTASADWYQVRTIRDTVGWVPANLLGIPDEVAAQVPLQGSPSAPTSTTPGTVPTSTTPGTVPTGATPGTVPTSAGGTELTARVINGGRMRSAPVIAANNEVGMINAGETVTLLQKNANGTWYRIRNPAGVEGWSSASLLDIPPDVAAQVPVA